MTTPEEFSGYYSSAGRSPSFTGALPASFSASMAGAASQAARPTAEEAAAAAAAVFNPRRLQFAQKIYQSGRPGGLGDSPLALQASRRRKEARGEW